MHRATFPMRRLVVVTGLALAGCGSGENKEATAPPPPSVGVVEVASRDVTPSTTFNGRVVAVDKVELRARIAGFLGRRSFTEGAEVQEGELLFEIEKQQCAGGLGAVTTLPCSGLSCRHLPHVPA